MRILELIENRLKFNASLLPSDSIFGGKSGASILSTFVSKEKLDDELLSTLNEITIIRGDITTEIWKIWCVSLLIQHHKVSLPENYSFTQMVNDGFKSARRFCYESPVKITSRMALYPFGLVSLKVLDNLEGIPFYVMIERIVLFMRDCEFFLTHSIPHVHDNQKLSASILHSTLRFMQLAEQKKVFTWKASQMKEYINMINYDSAGSQRVDVFILDYLSGRHLVSCKWTADELRYIGTIAFLYDCPGLFTAVWNPAFDLDEFPIDSLVGIGLGLLVNKLHNVDL